MTDELELLITGRQFRRMCEKEYENIRKKYNLRRVELDILYFLDYSENARTAKDIARIRQVSKAHISSAVENLVKNQMIETREDQADRRRVLLELTEKGREVVEEVAVVRKCMYEVVYRGMTEQEKEVMAVVQEQAKQYHAPIRMPEQEDFYFYRGQPFENRVNYGGYDLNIAMPGKHQAYNAGVAIEIALALCDKGFDISDEAIIEGIEETKFPARIEVFCKRPPLILDGMHNVQGAKALASVLEQEKVKHLTLVIGVLRGKGEEKMLELLAPYADRCCTVTPDSPRAIPAQELAQTAKRYYRETAFFESVPQALRHAMQFAENGLLICGSLYLAAEVRSLLEKTANTTV